jgi:catechol 2,3-dioxygenase-like lactoylglutathione lyase family enzyme
VRDQNGLLIDRATDREYDALGSSKDFTAILVLFRKRCDITGARNPSQDPTPIADMPPRIQHVSIPIPPDGADSAREFYGRVLRLQEIPVPREVLAHDAAWYRLGDTELHLFFEELLADRSARHFCIAVDDLHEVQGWLEDADVPAVGAAPLLGRTRLFCRDPFGNLIEITVVDREGETDAE